MKICFSTLACPEWEWPTMMASARDLGFDGIELRGVANELFLPNNPDFQGEGLKKTKAELQRMGLVIPILSTGAILGKRDTYDQAIKEISTYLELAEDMNVPYLRVLGDAGPEPEATEESLVRKGLEAMLPLAEAKGRTLLLETNGIYAESDKILALVKDIQSDALGILWDIQHPYRYYHEPVAETYGKLKPYIRHLHLKDSIVEDGKVVYKMFGRGDMPIREILQLLYKDGFDGFLSLEWVRRWVPNLEAPDMALPHYIAVIRTMLKKIQAEQE